MLKFMAILFIIFGIWGIVENIPFLNSNVENVSDSPYLQQLSKDNYIIYKTIKTITLFNRLIAIAPFICGILILWHSYDKAYFLVKIILSLKVVLLPFLIIILSKSFLYEASLINGDAIAVRANIFVFVFSAIFLFLVLLIYVIAIRLLKNRILYNKGPSF